MYFGCLDSYLGVWTYILGIWTCISDVWTCIWPSGLVLGSLDLYIPGVGTYISRFWICIWVPGLVFWMSGLVVWVSGFIFWASGLVFWASGLIMVQRGRTREGTHKTPHTNPGGSPAWTETLTPRGGTRTSTYPHQSTMRGVHGTTISVRAG